MKFRFNPKPTDEQGNGLIRLGSSSASVSSSQSGEVSGKSNTGKYIAVGAVAGVLGLAGIFALSSKSKTTAPQASTPVAVVPVSPTPVVPVAPVPVAPVQAPYNDNIREKESVIYRNQSEALYEAYIGFDGREVRQGQDFAAHVGLFDTGCVSILFASGPYAGTRVNFFPITRNGQSEVSFEVVGKDTGGNRFKALSSSERGISVTSMKSPGVKGEGAFLPGGTPRFEKTATKNGKTVVAFAMRGALERDNVFEIEIWNGDVYTVDLKTGDFTVDSVFVNVPTWKPGVKVDRNSFEVVKGRLDPHPAVRPSSAPSYRP